MNTRTVTLANRIMAVTPELTPVDGWCRRHHVMRALQALPVATFDAMQMASQARLRVYGQGLAILITQLGGAVVPFREMISLAGCQVETRAINAVRRNVSTGECFAVLCYHNPDTTDARRVVAQARADKYGYRYYLPVSPAELTTLENLGYRHEM